MHLFISSLIVLVLAFLAPNPCEAAYDWRLITTSGPSARDAAAGFFDPAAGNFYIFGGRAIATYGDMWRYHSASQTWEQVILSGAPSGRIDHVMVFDDARRKAFLLGGRPGTGEFWSYAPDTGTWVNLTSSESPTGSGIPAACYDSYFGLFVIYGATNPQTSTLDQMYFYDPDNDIWISSTSTPRPDPLNGERMNYDSIRRTYVLFGGAYSNETWEMNPQTLTWSIFSVLNPPQERAAPGWQYSGDFGIGFLFGGASSFTRFDDTWVFDPATSEWTQLEPSTIPTGRSGQVMVYDPTIRKFIMFGGQPYGGASLNDTWEFSDDATIPTPAPTNTPIPTFTPTLSPTLTFTPTRTPTVTPTKTPSPTRTPTRTPTHSPTKTPSPTRTPTRTPTKTPTRTPTLTPTSTPFPSSTPTPSTTPTLSPTPTHTPTPPADCFSPSPDSTPPRGTRCLMAWEGDGAVMLTWLPSVDPNGIAGYYVYRSASRFQRMTLVSPLITETEFLDAGAVNGRVWFYTVVAVDRCYQRSWENFLQTAVPHRATDADGDGLPDDWERAWIGDLRQDGRDDPDNDGLNNWEEYHRGEAVEPCVSLVTRASLPVMDSSQQQSRAGTPTLPLHPAGTNPLEWDSDHDGLSDGLDPDPSEAARYYLSPEVPGLEGWGAILAILAASGGLAIGRRKGLISG